ncbi:MULTISPECIES: ClbS/DfsB family four-helix bundle protein [unclassified Flavobacterium]|uniref:ClbS/DfsB family four-helix bundle protein n=1 Tax=unclassified Flavobacterium TaxID=196869 RepID=UPI001F12E974|nr:MULTISPECIES: ClbS/DfsB family four-helix bundle protein [unclassified Flavobacterium]UMY64824.1 ClbS/DfsB family four-helix bundle protein [Flavobacterium sp. HJ-32-4]
MPIPTNKDELRKAVLDDYRKLKVELSGIPGEVADRKELEGHAKDTMMSIHDLVAYLVGWGQLVLKWEERKNQGLEVDFPETGFKWNELGRLAQKFYADYEKDDFETLLTKLDTTTADILALIASRTDDALYGTAWYERYPLGRMIQLNTSSPFKNATGRIRKWKKRLK